MTMKKVIFTDAERAQDFDFDNIGTYSRAGDEAITGRAIGYPAHWSAFVVSAPSSSTARVAPGYYFEEEKIFQLEEETDIPLISYLPLVSTDKRYVAILARGDEDTANENRLVEIDADTEEAVLQSVPKTNVRAVEFVIQTGEFSPTPVKPVVAATDCAVCFVLLGSSGILAIEPSNDHRVKTLYEVEGRLTLLERRVELAFQRTDALETNMAAIQARLAIVPRKEIMDQLQRDVAATRRLLPLPDNARGYWYDPGLVIDDWDPAHVSWNARIREGVRLPYAAAADNQLLLATPSDPKMRITGGLMLPKWSDTVRIEVDGTGSYKDISDQLHVVTEAIERQASGSSISYGPSFNVCENTAEWAAVGSYHPGATFNVNGASYVSSGLSAGVGVAPTGQVADFSAWNADPGSAGHQGYSVQQVSYESWSYSYWEYITKEYGIPGSKYGQTILSPSAMIISAVSVKFTRVGTSGPVKLFLCELFPNGSPNVEAIIGKAELAVNQLSVGWVKFNLEKPVERRAGQRFAWFTATEGNHALATVAGNKFAQGSLFWLTDGVWAQGSNDEDFCFRLHTCVFEATRTVVEFQGMTLSGGISELQLLYSGWAPSGTRLDWEIKPFGSTTWTSILTGDPTPLNTLPTQISLRATFIGTTDLAPAIQLDETARFAGFRVALTGAAVSDQQNFGFSTTAVTVETYVDAFDPAVHTFQNRIITPAGTTVTPTLTTTTIDPDKPSRRRIVSTFALGVAVTGARVFPTMDTTTAAKAPFIQNIAMYAQ
jgi:hypothetical protein